MPIAKIVKVPVEVDTDHDVIYVALHPIMLGDHGPIPHSKRLADDIIVDRDKFGKIVGIEVLRASVHLHLEHLKT